MVCHWEDTDVVAQEMYSNVGLSSLLFVHSLIHWNWVGHSDLHMHSSGHFVIFHQPNTRDNYCILEIPTIIATLWNAPLFDEAMPILFCDKVHSTCRLREDQKSHDLLMWMYFHCSGSHRFSHDQIIEDNHSITPSVRALYWWLAIALNYVHVDLPSCGIFSRRTWNHWLRLTVISVVIRATGGRALQRHFIFTKHSLMRRPFPRTFAAIDSLGMFLSSWLDEDMMRSTALNYQLLDTRSAEFAHNIVGNMNI
jgi:hypothetical protein